MRRDALTLLPSGPRFGSTKGDLAMSRKNVRTVLWLIAAALLAITDGDTMPVDSMNATRVPRLVTTHWRLK